MKRLVKVTTNPFVPKMSNVTEVARRTVDGQEMSVINYSGKSVTIPSRYVRPSADMIRQHVKVTGAPGYADFPAIRLEVVSSVDSRGQLSIVRDCDDEFHVIPTKYLRFTGVAALDRDDREPGQ